MQLQDPAAAREPIKTLRANGEARLLIALGLGRSVDLLGVGGLLLFVCDPEYPCPSVWPPSVAPRRSRVLTVIVPRPSSQRLSLSPLPPPASREGVPDVKITLPLTPTSMALLSYHDAADMAERRGGNKNYCCSYGWWYTAISKRGYYRENKHFPDF